MPNHAVEGTAHPQRVRRVDCVERGIGREKNMKRMIAVLVLSILAGCRPETSKEEPGIMQVGNRLFAGIGIVGGTDTNAQAQITAVLNKHGIDSLMEGSVVYGIWVPREKVEEAERILKKDSKTKGYRMELKR